MTRTLARIGLAAIVLSVVLAAVLTINTLRQKAEPLADSPPSPLPIDSAAVGRLAQAIRIPTISTEATPPSAQSLTAFAARLERNFPRVHAQLTSERLAGGSLLYTWPGTNGAAPALLLAAHQDVVPAGHRWTHPPFSGAIAGGYVWGRGTIDDKASLMSILEAAERLLARGFRPKQTIYFAFGHDEERGGAGARAMAALLRRRGARVGLAVDEGFAVLDGVIGGVTKPVAMIGVAEKGYVSIELTADSPGGHSSMPSDDNAAVRVARAVTRIADKPLPARLDGPTGEMLDGLAPYSELPMRVALANRWLTAPLVKRQFLASPQTAASIRTTTAPTIFQAGTKDNVLPQRARAVINHRILPGETIDSVLAHDRAAVADPRVRLRVIPGGRDPSRPASTGSPEYRQLSRAVRATFPHAAIAPGLVVGATDGRHYEGLATSVLRFAPFTLREEDLARIHGSNERIGVADYMRAIAFYERLISGSQPLDS